MQGWIKLHRKFTEWGWYQNLQVKSLFLHLLLIANHKDGEWQGIPIKRGQLITGRKKLAKQTGLSEQVVRSTIIKLKSTNEIRVESTSKYSLITLINYNSYQTDIPTTNQVKCTTLNQQLTNNQPTTNHKQECKEGKECKEHILQYQPIDTYQPLSSEDSVYITEDGFYTGDKDYDNQTRDE